MHTSSVRWLRSYPYTLFGLILFFGMLAPFLLKKFSEWDVVYVTAAQHLCAGTTLYDLRDGYAYPPFMAFLSVPFTYLPPSGSRLAFYMVNALCLVVMCRSAWRIAGGGALEGQAAGDWREHAICLLGLACAFRYALDALAHQQTDLVIGALLLGGCHALLVTRAWTAATCFGLAAAMKCTPLLWCLYLVWQRRWLPALWLVVVAVGVNLLPELVSSSPQGGLWLSEWANVCLLPTQTAEHYPGAWHSAIIYNQSLSGLVQRWLVLDWADFSISVVRPDAPRPGLVKGLILGSELLLLAFAGWALWRRRKSEEAAPLQPGLEYSLVLIFMLLFSPMSSKPHFCPLLLPAFCLGRLALAQGSRVQLVLLLAAIVVGTLSIRGLTGVAFSSLMLWWGTITWSTLFLLAGCFVELCRPTVATRGSRVGCGTTTREPRVATAA